MIEDRRRVRRQLAGWRGYCLIDGALPGQEWRDCRILDLSMLGVGISFCDHRTDELVGMKVLVEFPARNDSIAISLEGVIKSVQRVDDVSVRAGIEFIEISPGEQAVATVLSALIEVAAESRFEQLARV